MESVDDGGPWSPYHRSPHYRFEKVFLNYHSWTATMYLPPTAIAIKKKCLTHKLEPKFSSIYRILAICDLKTARKIPRNLMFYSKSKAIPLKNSSLLSFCGLPRCIVG